MASDGRFTDPAISPARSLEEPARTGFTAAVRLAREQGLAVERPRVLWDEQNLIVHLAPSPVVARVATRIAWSRPDPVAWLAREVTVARHAAAHAGPVVAPTDLVDPGPHITDGYALSLWTYVTHSGATPTEREVGTALARLHMSLTDFPTVLPDRLPVHAQIENGLSALERDRLLDAATLTALRDRHAAFALELDGVPGTPGVVHGDAHPANLLNVDGEWRWIDLEETGFGPQEWDLAILAIKVDDPDEALSAYASAAGAPVPPPDVLLPFQRARELETVVWALGMAHQDPGGYRDFASERLAKLLDS
jgi:Ser/Thr protein kinase RdoA (MazF antagonist)